MVKGLEDTKYFNIFINILQTNVTSLKQVSLLSVFLSLSSFLSFHLTFNLSLSLQINKNLVFINFFKRWSVSVL